jgi:hypothetical protein
MGMLMVRCPKTGRAISTADTSNPGYLAAPLYFSAAPTVHTAGRGMSGLSKTHGFAIPTGLNVNPPSKRPITWANWPLKKALAAAEPPITEDIGPVSE